MNYFKNLSKNAKIGFVIVALLGAVDGLNKAYGFGWQVPDFVWPMLAALGITLQPKKE